MIDTHAFHLAINGTLAYTIRRMIKRQGLWATARWANKRGICASYVIKAMRKAV